MPSARLLFDDRLPKGEKGTRTGSLTIRLRLAKRSASPFRSLVQPYTITTTSAAVGRSSALHVMVSKESSMRTLCIAILGVALVLCDGTAYAQEDNAKKIVGIWELTKAGSDLPVGTLVEFTKDLKLNATLKDGKDEKITGTYLIEKDKITVKVIYMNQNLNPKTSTIKKLTDDALEIEDEDKTIDVFKKKR
jgi:uncharacterized protein (TIGR03066 family)